MSTSEETAENSGENAGERKMCRDFQRGVCRRHQCKFRHEISNTAPDGVMFCHDFQNRTCTRINCKFLHYSVTDEIFFRTNGYFPHEAENVMRDRGKGGPACKDFILGSCRRRNDCKFRHITYAQYQEENGNSENGHGIRKPHQIPSNNFHEEPKKLVSWRLNNNIRSLRQDYVKQDIGYSSIDDRHPNEINGVLYQTHDVSGYDSCSDSRVIRGEYTINGAGYDSYEPPVKKRFYEDKTNTFYNRIPLEEQNIILRKQVEELRKQVSDLTATNEFLLEQNAQLRMGGSRQGNVTAVTVPAVTITNTTVPPTTQPQPQVIRTVTASVATVPVSIGAVSMAPVQVAAPIVSMATPQTQIIANSAPIAIASNSQQLALAQQSLTGPATAPNQIITSSTQQQILASNTQLTLSNAQPTGQQILTPIGGPGQQLAMAQQSLAHNTSQALAMSNASQPIISYP
ncbi:zinc finger CCCH domain-containing protein 10-like [Ctenocephalides felis]|uniref:zinc finger CCCH domain-containing protein 10-like n=1 Tax=Ctenocephalides felis TaxID=7515 RepID=UPI000E6E3FFC|nr:zinc finger CCCH domain-containing protein 10-like [Ctenocephalides felis]